MKLYKYLPMAGALALAAGFSACSDDDETYDYPGVDGQVVLAPTVTSNFNIVKTPAAYVAPDVSVWNTDVRTRIPATEPIEVKFELDPAAVATYNAQNNTEYVAFPDNMVTLNVPEVTLEDGTVLPSSNGSSVTLTVNTGESKSKQVVSAVITDNQSSLASLDLDKTYIVAVRMSEVVKGTANLAHSGSNVSYCILNLAEKLINDEPGAAPKGQRLSVSERSGWSGTSEGTAWGADWSGAFNDDISSSYNYDSYPAGSSATIDMGREYTFDGIYAMPFYGYSSYALLNNGAEVLISSDGSDWTSLGFISGWTSTVTLYAPMTARYIKVIRAAGGWAATGSFNIFAL